MLLIDEPNLTQISKVKNMVEKNYSPIVEKIKV